jgi:hypothetical protein
VIAGVSGFGLVLVICLPPSILKPSVAKLRHPGRSAPRHWRPPCYPGFPSRPPPDRAVLLLICSAVMTAHIARPSGSLRSPSARAKYTTIRAHSPAAAVTCTAGAATSSAGLRPSDGNGPRAHGGLQPIGTHLWFESTRSFPNPMDVAGRARSLDSDQWPSPRATSVARPPQRLASRLTGGVSPSGGRRNDGAQPAP